MALRICMAGGCGRMGRRIIDLAAADPDFAIGGAVDVAEQAGTRIAAGDHAVTVTASLEEGLAAADVLIDFTLADACIPNVEAAAAAGKPVVVGTTGFTDDQRRRLEAAAGSVPIVAAPNMSVGVNLLFKLAGEVAARLGLDYNVEITEIHHNQKKDSPSGTAARLAERVVEGLGLAYPADAVFGREGMVGARPRNEIGVHAIRGSDVVGEHTVSFFGPGERIELTHKAHSRDNFAKGALVAAKFVAQAQPGLYDMQDVLGLR
jgi:4-hydroxy-tetrahydrodipicolinate reductase